MSGRYCRLTPPLCVFVALLLTLISAAPQAFAQTAAPATPATPGPEVGAGTPAPARTDTASYDIQARFDPATWQIHATETISYRNPSANTLSEIWLKLYLNAFRDQNTIWMREASGIHRGNDYDPSHPGWIALERLHVLGADGSTVDVLPADAASAETVLRVPLPRPIGPGETIHFAATWTSQLPRVFARTGVAPDSSGAGLFVMAGQWYPKLAVYDRGTWDVEPWHANSEFFADFGDYTLALTVPGGYVTGASGVRDSRTENRDGTATVRYRAESVSDVAWTAWAGYRQVTRSIIAAGQRVELELLAPAASDRASDGRYFDTASATLDMLGRWFGAYPWPKLTLVVPPANASGAGGMEYPTLVTLGLATSGPFGIERGIRDVEVVTAHEIAHQWSPMQTATNEGREAWLDEGLADYATTRVLAALYGTRKSLVAIGPIELGYGTTHRAQFEAIAATERLDQPSWTFPSYVAYGATVYSKGMLTFQTLERMLGTDRFTSAMHGYFDRWRWRHPTAADLQAALEAGTGESLGWFFQPLVFGTGVVEYRIAGVSERGATVARTGSVAFPVDVRLTLADGTTARQTWSGADSSLVLDTGGRELGRVELDPDQTIGLELDRLNDSVDVVPSRTPLVALGVRLLGLAQTALQLFGTIG
ncbi:MAG: M1 family metallopeptidase [Chloroflexi bacterium]|nr:M1 family metallopeptidase [Chloroflexota bacterium]